MPAASKRRQQCLARLQAKMALHQWNGKASSNIRKFTEEERQELREQFASVSVNYFLLFLFFSFLVLGGCVDLCGLIS